MNRIISNIVIVVSVFLSFSFQSFAGDENKIKQFVMIVPVYRELYNQNIGQILNSIYNQNLEQMSFNKIDVWFIVNHTQDAKENVIIENRETVQFLNDLKEGKVPKVRSYHHILQAVSKMSISDKLNIHILDFTNPGRPSRNIGEIRDIALKKAIQNLPATELDNIIITQLDADSTIRKNYVQSNVKSFEVADLQFGILNMTYSDQADSESRVYQRKIVTDFKNAAYSFRLALDGDMPYGGGPRIVARASALVAVGGVPHELVGEDCKLIEKLKSKFKGQGMFLDIPVEANFRAREDGYDASIYLKQLDKPIEFSDYEYKAVEMLRDEMRRIQQDPLLYSLYNEAYLQQEREYLRSVKKLKRLIGILIDDIQNGMKSIDPALDFPVFINNGWLKDLIVELDEKHHHDDAEILHQIAKRFPYYFSDPPNETLLNIFSLRAATKVLLQKPFIKGKYSVKSYAPLFRILYPQTANSHLDNEMKAKYEGFKKEWKEWSALGFPHSKLNPILKAERKPCPNCGGFHGNSRDTVPPKYEYDNLLGTLKEYIDMKDDPGYFNSIKPTLKEFVEQYLDYMIIKKENKIDGLSEIKELISFSDKKYADYLIKEQFKIIKTSWNEILDKVNQIKAGNYFAKVYCDSCKKNHSQKIYAYLESDPIFNLKEFKEFLTLIENSETTLSRDQINDYIDLLTTIYNSGYKRNLNGFSNRLNPNELEKLINQFKNNLETRGGVCEIIY